MEYRAVLWTQKGERLEKSFLTGCRSGADNYMPFEERMGLWKLIDPRQLRQLHKILTIIKIAKGELKTKLNGIIQIA